MAPSWLTRRTVLTAGLAAVGVVATSLDLSGRWKAASIVVLAVLAVVAVVVEHGDKARADAAQAARSRLDVQVSLVPGVIERAADVNAFVDRWIAAERRACLASVEKKKAPAPSALDLDELQRDGDEDGLTLGELESIEARLVAGEPVSDSERRSYAAAKSVVSRTVSAAAAASKNLGVLAAFSSPEDRTEQQYRDEVDAYLDEGASLLRAAALCREIDTGTAGVQVEVTNATDRNYTSVEVEIYLPGDVRAVYPDSLPDLPEAPARPRPFGSRKPTDFGYTLASGILGVGPVIPRLRSGPVIDNEGSARVTYEPVDLRPGETVPLDTVHLVVPASAGTALAGTWSATAKNADGRAAGGLALTVAESTLDTDAVLTAWLDGDDGET